MRTLTPSQKYYITVHIPFGWFWRTKKCCKIVARIAQQFFVIEWCFQDKPRNQSNSICEHRPSSVHKSAQNEWIFSAPFQLFHFHGFGWLANRYTWSPFLKFSVVVTKMSLIICYYQNAALFSSDAHSYSPTRLTRLACCARSRVQMIWVHMITCVRTIHCRSWQVPYLFFSKRRSWAVIHWSQCEDPSLSRRCPLPKLHE